MGFFLRSKKEGRERGEKVDAAVAKAKSYVATTAKEKFSEWKKKRAEAGEQRKQAHQAETERKSRWKIEEQEAKHQYNVQQLKKGKSQRSGGILGGLGNIASNTMNEFGTMSGNAANLTFRKGSQPRPQRRKTPTKKKSRSFQEEYFL